MVTIYFNDVLEWIGHKTSNSPSLPPLACLPTSSNLSKSWSDRQFPWKALSHLAIFEDVSTACINNRPPYLQYYLKCVKGSMHEQQHITVNILLISFSHLLHYTLSLKHHNCVFGSDYLQTWIALTIPHIFYIPQYPFRGITNCLGQIFSFTSTLSVLSPCWRSELDWCLREI